MLRLESLPLHAVARWPHAAELEILHSVWTRFCRDSFRACPPPRGSFCFREMLQVVCQATCRFSYLARLLAATVDKELSCALACRPEWLEVGGAIVADWVPQSATEQFIRFSLAGCVTADTTAQRCPGGTPGRGGADKVTIENKNRLSN